MASLCRRPTGTDEPPRHLRVLLHGLLYPGSICSQAHGAVSDRVVAGVLCRPVGHRSQNPHFMYNSCRDVWAPELLARRPEVTMATITADLHNLYRVQARLRVQPVARFRAFLLDADAGHARRHYRPPAPDRHGYRVAGAEGRNNGLSLARAPGASRSSNQPVRTFLRAHQPVRAVAQ